MIDAVLEFRRPKDIHCELLKPRYPRSATDKHNFLEGSCRELCSAHRSFARSSYTIEKFATASFKLRPAYGNLEVFGPVLVGTYEGHSCNRVDLTREFHFDTFRGLFQSLQSHWIRADIDAFVLSELVCKEVKQAIIEVVATKMAVAISAEHLEHTIAYV